MKTTPLSHFAFMLRAISWFMLATVSMRLMAAGTDNHELIAVPCPGEVAIDGHLADWDRSGKIFVCSDVENLRDQYSAWVAMMYDEDALYVGIDWSDPTPMMNNYQPGIDIDLRQCFHSDSIQLHFRTDQARQVFGWHYAKENRPGVSVMNGRKWYKDNPIVYIDGLGELGITEAFQRKATGNGYTQEMRIPWSAIVASGKPYRQGESFDCILDLVWGQDSGKGWPLNHMMDVVEPGKVHTGWFWEVGDIYGKVKLSPTGSITLPQPEFLQERTDQPPLLSGVLPIRVTLPTADAEFFTVAINDATGKRIRNLAGDFPVKDFVITGSADTVEVLWDCLDDNGKAVEPGEYSIIGLTRGTLSASYEMSFYNPGTPPWETADRRGSWGADHSSPSCVARTGDMVAVGWHGAEGGSGVIGVGADGFKKWGEQQGASAMTGDDRALYFMLNDPWAGKSGLARLGNTDGSYLPFTVDGQRHFPMSLETIFDGAAPGNVVSMAVHDRVLVLAMSHPSLAILDSKSGALLRQIPTAGMQPIVGVAFSNDGILYALSASQVYRIDVETGESTKIPTPGLADARAIDIDREGNLVVADMGPDCQVKAFSPDGDLVYTAGKQGGRPVYGDFDKQTMMRVSSIAVDSKGQIWATEDWNYPRRVSVWGKDGQLIRDYIGNCAYSSSDATLHDQDPTIAYAGTVEMKLDKETRDWQVTRILWVPGSLAYPDDALPENSMVGKFEVSSVQRLRSDVSGVMREYLYCRQERGDHQFHAVFMQRGSTWLPVAAVMKDRFWNDANADGVIQETEVSQGGGPVGGWWGTRIGMDLSIYTDGVMRYAPIGFTGDGAPMYGATGMTKLANDRGDLVPIDEEQMLIVASHTGWGGTSYIRSLDINTGKELWRYPAPYYGVHGSHRAPMPSPGMLMAGLKNLGYAKINESVGNVFAIRNNLGCDYFLTSDGLFIGELFRDSRRPGPSMPDHEEDAYGMAMEQLTEGSEPFSGWFGKQSDGKVRMITGMADNAGTILEIKGLDSVRKFKGPQVSVDSSILLASEHHNLERASREAASVQHRIGSLQAAPAIDGKADDWRGVKAMEIKRQGFEEKGSARLAYDQQNLYILYEVMDSSPWLNEGKDFRRLFKTGDAIDLQLDVSSDSSGKVQSTTSRLVFANWNDKPTCVLMKPVDDSAAANAGYAYASPIASRPFARVEVRDDVVVAVRVENKKYFLEAAIPLAVLGLEPQAGLMIRGDVGFISSDAQGRINVARTYWSNKMTNLTSDLPTEAWLYPGTWGVWQFE